CPSGSSTSPTICAPPATTTRVAAGCSAWSDNADGCSPTCTAEARSATRKSSGDSVCDGETARVSGNPGKSLGFFIGTRDQQPHASYSFPGDHQRKAVHLRDGEERQAGRRGRHGAIRRDGRNARGHLPATQPPSHRLI